MSVNLWAIAMAKDEGDIVYDTLCHLAANDVDGIIIANNLSKDNTKEEMYRAKETINSLRPDINVILLDDDVVAYTQSEKMTNLAAMARLHGAQWIIPFDVDEIWYSPQGTLKEAFEKLQLEEVDAYKVLYTNHSITDKDPEGISPFHTMNWKWNLPTNHKSCFRFRSSDSFVRISNGNHFVQHNGWNIGSNIKTYIDDYGHDHIIFGPQLISIRHFQWRSIEQFIRKILKSYESCKALPSGADLYNGAAWAEHFKIYEADGTAGLEKYYYENVFVSGDTGALVFDPAPIMELR